MLLLRGLGRLVSTFSFFGFDMVGRGRGKGVEEGREWEGRGRLG